MTVLSASDDDDRFGPELRTAEVQALPTPPPAGGRRREKLVSLVGEEAGRSYEVGAQAVAIGREPACAVLLDEPSVSRRHARLTRLENGAVYLEDLGSRNGTFVNGARIDRPRTLSVGDRIRFGSRATLLFTFDDPLEAELRERQKMEAIGRMAAGIAHDFNNLVGAAQATFAHVRSRYRASEERDAELEECCADLESALERAAELTRTLATLGRREGTPREPVDVAEVCDEVVRLCRRTFGRSYDLSCDVAPGMMVFGSRTELHQVLLNLFLNARDAMPEGGSLSVAGRRLEALESRRPSLRLLVSDTGVGMSAEAVERAFEPFFTTKGVGRGSVLGLSTVAELVRGMGGGIEVESERGRGTTFEIRLPLHLAPMPRRWRTRAPSAAHDARPVHGRVVVADDQDLVRRSLGRLLQAAGHEVLYARDGREALMLWARSHPRPDVLVVDLDMPGYGGEYVLREVTGAPGAPAVVIVSGHWDPDTADALRKAGAEAYLPKPVDVAELRRTVTRLLLERRR
ncbi:MAG TPA: FHA domain-containing protein [Sandaracinaceae bacterium LLY-WYZ-13_1]|nr:FHA domain-containing protein [Sandaracinaceae bacterium LLY-WYZ-13_1]